MKKIIFLLLLFSATIATSGCGDNTYTALDREIDFQNYYGSLYAIPVTAGDELHISASTDADANYIFMDSTGFNMLLSGNTQIYNNIYTGSKANSRNCEQIYNIINDGCICLLVWPSNPYRHISGHVEATINRESDLEFQSGFSGAELVSAYNQQQQTAKSNERIVQNTGYVPSSGYNYYNPYLNPGYEDPLTRKFREDAEEGQKFLDEMEDQNIKDTFTYP